MYLLPKKIIIKTPGALCILLPISFFHFCCFGVEFFLFVWCFSSQSRIFYSYGDVTLPANGCKFWPILGTYDHWAVIKGYYQVIKGYSTCHTYCDTGHPFKMVISEDPRTRDTRTCCRAFINEAVNTCLNDLGFSRLGFEHPTSACNANALTFCATAAAFKYSEHYHGDPAEISALDVYKNSCHLPSTSSKI